MGTLRRLEQLEKHSLVRQAVPLSHIQRLVELLEGGTIEVSDCTDEELSTIVSLPCADGLDVTQLTDDELQALIDLD
jgi:hypothetical protein